MEITPASGLDFVANTEVPRPAKIMKGVIEVIFIDEWSCFGSVSRV